MSPTIDNDDIVECERMNRWAKVISFVTLGMVFVILVIAFFLVGCSPWGGVQTIDSKATRKESSQIKDAVDAASRVTVESSVYPSKVGPATLIVSGSNNNLKIETPREEPKPNIEKKETTFGANVRLDNAATVATVTTLEESTKSPWFYLIVTLCIVVVFVVAEYIRRMWLGGISFKNSQAGGIRVFDKMDEVVSDIQGHATNPDVIAEIAKIKRILREKKADLQLKKRDDR